MKTLIKLTTIIAASLVMAACSNVGFDQGSVDKGQSTPNPQPSPTPGPSPSPTPSPTPGPSPSPSPTPSPTPSTATFTKNVTVPVPKVDVVFVIDTSMTNVNAIAQLNNSLPAFFASIQSKNIDWQACVITTDVTAANSAAGTDGALLAYAGEPLPWIGSPDGAGWFYEVNQANPYVINSQTASLSSVLGYTAQYIQAISPGQGNAQGIGALYQMVMGHQSSGCFRSGATLATVLLSAKDENATYGSCNRAGDGLAARGLTAGPNENFCEPVAAYEDPSTAQSAIINALNTKLVFNSIIVQPNDGGCLAAQTIPESQFNPGDGKSWFSPAFYGNEYVSMSHLTHGSISSICAANNNYTSNLNGINAAITQVLDSVTLDCTPVAQPTVSISPNFSTTATLNGNLLTFTPAIPSGSQVAVTYKCNK